MYFSEGFQRHNAEGLSPEKALKLYERDQLLWIRLPEMDREKCMKYTTNVLSILYLQHQSLFKRNWHVENVGDYSEGTLTPESVFRPNPDIYSGSWYCSTILQKNKSCIASFLANVPFSKPALFSKDFKHDDGVWLFLGSNPSPEYESNVKARVRSKKRKKSTDLSGRSEHTDDVDHSGTWHVQLRGTKTWYLRPCATATDWGENKKPPVLSGLDGAVKTERGGLRLRVKVEQGDLFIINTRAWFHRTIIEPQEGGISCSYARDFYIPEPLLSPLDVSVGEIILKEDEIPDEIPRSSDPNCSLAEVEVDGIESIVMVALKKIKAGEEITVAEDEEEESDNSCDSDDEIMDGELACNVKGLDPRLICQKRFQVGEFVLVGDDIPETLPNSTKPTCVLEKYGDNMVLKAISNLAKGDICTIAAGAGNDDDLEEYEWDPDSQSLVPVNE